MKRVVVTGIGTINSIASNVKEFTEALKSGKCGTKEIDLFDTTGYRTNKASQVSKEVTDALFDNKERELRVIEFVKKACAEAMEQCGNLNVAKNRMGVSLATSLGCIDGIDKYMEAQSKGDGSVDGRCYLNTCAKLCDILSRQYSVCGPVYTVSTACAAGSNSIGIAMDAIRYGRTDAMICGGADPISRISINGFNALKSLSFSGYVRSFSEERDGLIIGEGAAILILEEYEHAKERGAKILAEVAGYGLSNDAYHLTTPDPHGGGATRSMEKCLEDAGIGKECIDYVNAHGTGTVYNDNMEMLALRNVFGDRLEEITVTSNKGMIGHTLGAAGSIEFLATVICINENFIPATINFETPMAGYEKCNFVPNESISKKINYAISNSFAFAGNCASIMVKRAE